MRCWCNAGGGEDDVDGRGETDEGGLGGENLVDNGVGLSVVSDGTG